MQNSRFWEIKSGSYRLIQSLAYNEATTICARKFRTPDPKILLEDVRINKGILGRGRTDIVRQGIYQGQSVAIKEDGHFTKSVDQILTEFSYAVDINRILDHPHMVPIYGIHIRDSDAMPLLVMQFCDGGNLPAQLRRHPVISEASKLTLALQSAKPIQAAHHHDIILQDIKTSNYMFMGQPDLTNNENIRLKMIDFVSKDYTLKYSCKERIKSGISKKTNIYSWGMTFFEIATGQPPFANIQNEQLLEEYVHHDARPYFPRGIPPLWREIMNRCWDKEITMDEVVELLIYDSVALIPSSRFFDAPSTS